MLFKLSITGLKAHFKDYLVLFSGLTISSAIFYMFASLALNTSFLSKNSMISAANTQFVFAFGLVLLAIITFVYLNYANNFLLNLRKHDYGMFMMLGAKSSKIGILIFLETMILGFVATGIGIVLGVFLTQITTKLLVANLNLQLTSFIGFYLPAIIFTVVFFLILFLLAALINRVKLVKTPVLELLHDTEKPVNYARKRSIIISQAIAGLVLLAVGYWAMVNVQKLVLLSIPIGLVTITLGSYFIFNSLMTVIIDFLRQRHGYLYKKFRIFTVNQLKFRIVDYTRILSIISILFALALGAITVGMGFQQTMNDFSKMYYYDGKIVTETPAVKDELAKLNVTVKAPYSFKKVGQTIYLNKQDFDQNPYKKVNSNYDQKTGKTTQSTQTLTGDELMKNSDNLGYTLSDIFGFPTEDATYQVVDNSAFQKLNAATQTVTMLKVKDFAQDQKALLALESAQIKADPKLQDSMQNTKPLTYQMMNQLLSGFEFMGFFLGIAFLTMLASTLMFKVLSGAQSDKRRYLMLNKMGVRRQVLKNSIKKEIGVLFLLPAVLGVIHVLFGLKFFTAFMANPYYKIWIPFTIFLVLYSIYYLVTVWIYQNTVLARENLEN